MKYTVDLTEKKVLGPYETESKDAAAVSLATYVDSVKDKYPFSSGLLPLNGTGILSIQRGFGYEQIIYQLVPAVDIVSWGARESTANKALYNLAVPYRIYIADFKDGGFIGCRHFFSPEPIYSWDQKLYVPNLPNTNCIGYNGTSVGWVCLYHRHDTKAFTLAERIEYFLNRMNGVVEPYNDANMSQTDGVRFYQRQGAPSFMWDAKNWQKKSLEEGFKWTLNPDLYIPFEVSADPENHAQSFADKEPVYTLRRAAYEPYSAHYNDKVYTKPWMIESIENIPHEMLLSSIIGTPVGNIVKPIKAPKLPETPEELKKYFADDVPGLKMKEQEAILNLLTAVKTYKCQNCLKLVKTELTPVAVDFHVDGLNIQNIVTIDWCDECVEADSISIHSHYKYKDASAEEIIVDLTHQDLKMIRINKNMLLYNQFFKNYFMHVHAKNCNHCGQNVHINNTKEFFVYSYQNGMFYASGCISCITTYAQDYDSKKLVLLEDMKEFQVSNLEFIPGSGKPNFVQSTVFSTQPIIQCACKLLALSKEYGPLEKNEYEGLGNICKACLEIDNVTGDPVHKPMFNLVEVPLDPII